MDTNYSLSDIASVIGNDGFGGGNCWVMIILFALIFGNGGFFGRNNDGYGQFATAASQQDILFGQKFSDIDNKIDRLGNGLADLGFSLNNSIKDGNAMVAGRVVDEGRAIQTQIAECCCATKEAIHAEGEATRSLLQQNKIDALQSQVNNLQMQNAINSATFGTVKYPTTSTWSMNGNPFCGGNTCLSTL